MLRIGFKTRPTGTLKTLAERIDEKKITLDNAFFMEEDKWYLFLTITSDVIYDYDGIFEKITGSVLLYEENLEDNRSDSNRSRLLILSLEPYPFILSLLLRNKAVPNKIAFSDRSLHVVVSVDDWDDFQSLGEEIEDKLGDFELLEVSQVDELGEPLNRGQTEGIPLEEITDKQMKALETAYKMGYFESPSQATASDVAEELGVVQSTFSQRLRKAESNLLRLIFE